MKNITLLIFALVIIVSGCSKPAGDVVNETTPTPSATASPTPTPKPSSTPKPTSASKPSTSQNPNAVTLSGTGKKVTEKFQLPHDICIAKASHQGMRSFKVSAFDGDLTKETGLINKYGNYSGEALLKGKTGDELVLQVDADGVWEFIIEPIGMSDNAEFSGMGDKVSGMFTAPENGVWLFNYEGNGIFHVKIHGGGRSEYVQTEYGKAIDNAEAVVRFPDSSCFWEVKADGNWSLRPKE